MDFTSKGHIWNKTNKTKHLPNNVKHLISRFINFLPMTSFESALPWSTAIVTMIMHLPRQYKACIFKTQQALLPQVQFCWQPRSLSPRNSSLLSRVLNCCISWHTYPPPPTTPPPPIWLFLSPLHFSAVCLFDSATVTWAWNLRPDAERSTSLQSSSTTSVTATLCTHSAVLSPFS